MLYVALKNLKSKATFRRSVRRGLRSPYRGDQLMFGKISGALEAARRKPSVEFARWAALIEARRRSLDQSPEVLEIIDFGAGAAAENRPLSTEARGVRTTATLSQIVRASKPPHWCRLLYELCRRIEPAAVLEMGTCVGISASYLGAALEDSARGRMITLEGDPAIAALANETLRLCGVSRVRCDVGAFDNTFRSAVEELKPIGLAFIDGNHREEATMRYFERLLPAMTPGGTLVFDDISWSSGMHDAWVSISRHAASKCVFDLGSIGIVTV